MYEYFDQCCPKQKIAHGTKQNKIISTKHLFSLRLFDVSSFSALNFFRASSLRLLHTFLLSSLKIRRVVLRRRWSGITELEQSILSKQ